jgi:exopolysaccharide production protein ExoZ
VPQINATDRLYSAQALRAVAAIAVVVRHAWPDFKIGGAGVDLFFVMSGFMMVHSSRDLFGSLSGSCRFLEKRLIRIYPAYWIATWLLLLIAPMPGSEHMLKSLALVPEQTTAPFLTPAWTLTYEVFFYGLFFCFVFLPQKRAVVCVCTALAVGVLVGAMSSHFYLAYYGNPIVLEFSVGAVFGHLFSKGLRLSPNQSALVSAIGALMLIAVSFEGELSGQTWLRLLYWGVPCAVLFFGVIFGPSIKALEIRPLQILGDASYAIYLTHWLWLFRGFSPETEFVFAIIFGVGFRVIVEKPALQFSSALVSKYSFNRRGAVGAAPSTEPIALS